SPLLFFFSFFYCYGPHSDLPSFPTRRSSDLRLHSIACVPPRWPDARPQDRGGGRARRRADGVAWTGGHVTGRSRRERRSRRVERSEEHTSELQSRSDLVCRLLLEKKKNKINK